MATTLKPMVVTKPAVVAKPAPLPLMKSAPVTKPVSMVAKPVASKAVSISNMAKTVAPPKTATSSVAKPVASSTVKPVAKPAVSTTVKPVESASVKNTRFLNQASAILMNGGTLNAGQTKTWNTLSGGLKPNPVSKTSTAPAPDTMEQDKINGIIKSITDSANAGYDSQSAQLGQAHDAQLADIARQYQDAVNTGQMDTQSANEQFTQAKAQIEQQAYQNAQTTAITANDLGIQNSAQFSGLQAGDNARTMTATSTATTARDKAITDIQTRLANLSNQKSLDETNANSTYNYGLVDARGQANKSIADGMTNIQNTDLTSYLDFQNKSKEMAIQHTNDLDTAKVQHTYDVANINLQGKIDMTKLSAQQKNDLAKMAVQQGYDVTNMTQKQKNDLITLGTQHGYDVANINLNQKNDLAKMAVQQGYDMKKIGAQKALSGGGGSGGSSKAKGAPVAKTPKAKGALDDIKNQYVDYKKTKQSTNLDQYYANESKIYNGAIPRVKPVIPPPSVASNANMTDYEKYKMIMGM